MTYYIIMLVMALMNFGWWWIGGDLVNYAVGCFIAGMITAMVIDELVER